MMSYYFERYIVGLANDGLFILFQKVYDVDRLFSAAERNYKLIVQRTFTLSFHLFSV